MQILVLGSAAVAGGDGVEESLSLQRQRLLGLLVVEDGGVVSSDRIAEYVSDGQVDGSTVRTAVSRLRKVVGDRVEHVGDGYRLVLSDGELAAPRFISRLDSARELQPEERAVRPRTIRTGRPPPRSTGPEGAKVTHATQRAPQRSALVL